MTISELIKTAHADAKAKGAWEGEVNTAEKLMLIVSECGKAMEAHRSGKRADIGRFQVRADGNAYVSMFKGTGSKEESVVQVSPFDFAFKWYIKDTFEDHLACIVIRIADFCGSRPDVVDWMQADDGLYAEDYDGPADSFSLGEQILSLVQMLIHSGASDHMMRPNSCGEYMGSAMRECFSIAQYMRVDIERHIELRLAYDRGQTRKN